VITVDEMVGLLNHKGQQQTRQISKEEMKIIDLK